MKRTITILAILALAGVAAAAMMSEPGRSTTSGPVSTHTVRRGDLQVTVTEQGTLESSNNTEIKCKVRGDNTIIWVVDSGAEVQAGDELVRLDTLVIEEEIAERTKFAHLAEAQVARSAADVARAKLAISAYLEGTFVEELSTFQKDLAIAESQLLNAKNRRDHSRMMAKSEYASELEVEEREFAVSQAELRMELINTQIDVLEKFTKAEQLATLRGELRAAEALHEANVERAYADNERLKRAEEELEHCVVKAQRAGLVIYPSDKQWEDAPEIEEGATVHKDQILLLMPDLTQMQVKVGIHESIIDRIRNDMTANVTLGGRTLEGKLSYVAPVAQPAGWWTGNVVKYDTVVAIPPEEGLKPGMSVEVEVVIATHNDVLTVPTAAVIETRDGHACWVQRGEQIQRRPLKLGDSSDMFIVVESGLAEGDEVILDPLAHIEEAQLEAAKTLEEEVQGKGESN